MIFRFKTVPCLATKILAQLMGINNNSLSGFGIGNYLLVGIGNTNLSSVQPVFL
jgi:hypothetical protein